jgi:hypothetical protein
MAEGRDIEQNTTIANRVKVTIGNNGGTWNQPRDQDAGPWQHNRQCQCDHQYERTGSRRDMDSAIVAIQHEQQEEPTVLNKPSV